MKPSVFLYNQTGDGLQLYVGPLTTAEGLALLDPTSAVTIREFGATSYQHHGFATEKDLPALPTVGELRSFLEADVGLITFSAAIEGGIALSSHDDGECHFEVPSRATLMALMQKVVPPACSGLVINALLTHPGLYVACGEDGAILKFPTFDAYVDWSKPLR
jgi:hypothetical protein